MHAYTEILKPSVVTHSLIMAAESPDDPLLIVVRGNSLLQVFADLSSKAGPRWVAEFPLQGTVTNVSSIGGRYVVVTFLHAKMVVLHWDAARLEFSAKSLHYYEKLADRSNFDVADSREHRLSIDDANKCLLFHFQKEFAAFVRFDSLENPLVSNTAGLDKAQSSIINTSDLCAVLQVSEILEMVLLPAYNEPTLAILASNQPTWSGLVGADGAMTRSLHVVALKPQPNNRILYNRIVHIPKVRFDVFRIVPLNNVPKHVALVVAASELFRVNESAELVSVRKTTNASAGGASLQAETSDDVDDWAFENCLTTQVPGTHFVVCVLASGTTVSIDLAQLEARRLNTLPAKVPTSLIAHNDQLVISSRTRNTLLCRCVVAGSRQDDDVVLKSDSMEQMYDNLLKQAPLTPQIEAINVDSELVAHGALSSVTTIDNGMACGTEDGILIVERELPLDEVDAAPLNTEVEPGKFWLVGATMPKNPVLITTGSTSKDSAKPGSLNGEGSEDGTPSKRRRVADSPEIFRTSFSELYPSSSRRNASKSNNVPRGIASDQLTLAVRELGNTLLVVQSKALALLDSRNLKLLKHESTPLSTFAEIRGNHILILTHERVCQVHDATTLELVHTAEDVDVASVSGSLVLHSTNNILRVQSLAEQKGYSYDMSNMDKALNPLKPSEDKADDEHNNEELDDLNANHETSSVHDVPVAEQNSQTTEEDSEGSIIAIYALQFKDQDYIGIHLGRLFAIYEPVGPLLVKRFSVPFVVNQSPILIPEFDLLVFRGAKTHVVVKGKQAAFQCHRLQLYGDQLLDVVVSQKLEKTEATHELAWLDAKQTLHFARLDTGVDFYSNALPLRHIAFDRPDKLFIKDIGYHDEFAAVIVGGNELVRYDASVHKNENNASAPAQEQPEEEEAVETHEQKTPPAHVYEGRVYALPLTSYKFQPEPMAHFHESLLTLKIVDSGDAGDKQMLAVGTAMATPELDETNGHIHLYNILEDESRSDSNEPANSASNANPVTNGAAEEPVSDSEPAPLKVEEFASELLRGAVSSIAEVMGFLAVAHGQQVHLYNFQKRMEPIGFYDTQVYMQDIKAVRNIILMGERLRGPRLLNFALNPHRLDLLATSDGVLTPHGSARAPRNPVTTTVDAVCNGLRGDLAVVSTTLDGRLQLLQYDPDNPLSTGGPRLVPLASFYTGRMCNATTLAQVQASEDLIAYGVTSDGTLFSVKPLLEEGFRTLFVLTQQIMDKEPSVAGLNPRMHRSTLSTMPTNSQQLIDVNFAQQFWKLPRDRQAVYARRLGFQGMAQVRRALNVEGRDVLRL